MAIGLGWMFGFHFKENFRYPYGASSIREFWRRWHISLSSWFQEYLYIPLGGNRKGRARTCINKFLVFLCTGIWHGANVTFLFWGIYHGFFLMLEEFIPWLRKKGGRVKQACMHSVHRVCIFPRRHDRTGILVGEKYVYRSFRRKQFFESLSSAAYPALSCDFCSGLYSIFSCMREMEKAEGL